MSRHRAKARPPTADSQREAAGDHLYANRVRVYPRAVHGPVRRIKWAILIVCLAIYYLVPWLRWDRGAGQPDQAVLLIDLAERFYFFNLEIWPQEIYYLDRPADPGRGRAVPGHQPVRPRLVRLHLPADGLDRPVHVGRAPDRGRSQRAHEARRRAADASTRLAQDAQARDLARHRAGPAAPGSCTSSTRRR